MPQRTLALEDLNRTRGKDEHTNNIHCGELQQKQSSNSDGASGQAIHSYSSRTLLKG